MGLMTFTGKWDQYTSAVTNDSYSYQWELNPVHWVQIQQSNHCAKAVPFFFLNTGYIIDLYNDIVLNSKYRL